MRLGPGAHSVSAVKVGARRNMVNRLANVDEMEEPEKRQRIERAIEEPRVFLSPLVAGKCASLTILKICNICASRLASEAWAFDAKRGRRTLPHLRLALPARLQIIKGVDHGENLHRTDGREHVRIMAGGSPESTAFVLA